MKDNIRDKGFIKGIFFILLFVAVMFVLLSFGKPYFRYYTLGSHTRNALKMDIGSIDVIRAKIKEDAKELNIPLEDEDLQVVLENKTIRVKATWSDTVDFWGYYQKKLNFTMNEEY
jgi:hypothetical protein